MQIKLVLPSTDRKNAQFHGQDLYMQKHLLPINKEYKGIKLISNGRKIIECFGCSCSKPEKREKRKRNGSNRRFLTFFLLSPPISPFLKKWGGQQKNLTQRIKSCKLEDQCTRNTPITVASSFRGTLWNLYGKYMFSSFHVPQIDIFRIGDCTWTPVGTTQVG